MLVPKRCANILRRDSKELTLTMDTIIPPFEKRCPYCQSIKPASAFYSSRHFYDGLSSYCRSCIWQHSQRDKNPPPKGHKRCSCCQEIKPLEEFFADRTTRDGRGYECKSCYRERQQRLVSLFEPTDNRKGSKKGIPHKRRPQEDLPEGHKRCLKCDQIKPTTLFYRSKKGNDGLYSYCKECEKDRPRLPILIPETKRCPKCRETKPSEEFYLNRGLKTKDGLSSYCRKCSKASAARPYSYVKDRRRVLRRYNLTVEEYDLMLQEQDGKCAVCGHPEQLMRDGKILELAIDHCHVTDAVRGLLCSNCNRALGLLYEDPERVEGLLRYIRERVLY